MSDILIPVAEETDVKVFAREVDGSIREVSSHADRMIARRHINRLNFVHGHRTGVYYFIEEEMN